VREFCGHGIGKRFHEEPQILHYGRPGQGARLEPGMTFTVEPMINAGKRDIRQLADGWTIVTADHSLSAQWEHTILVTDEAFEVLTLSRGAPPPPSFVPRPRPELSGSATAVSARAPARSGTAELRAWLRERREDLKARYYKRSDPNGTLAAHAGFVDVVLQKLWEEDVQGRGLGIALVAVGGYGRGLLYPHSDVDVLVLLPDGEKGGAAIERFIHALWDIGLDPGHSVRTVSECVEEAAKDITVDTSLLEARLVAGDGALLADLDARLRAQRDVSRLLRGEVPRAEARGTSASWTRPTTSSRTSRRAPAGFATCRWSCGSRARPRSAPRGASSRRAGSSRRPRPSTSRPTSACSRTCASACITSRAGARTGSCSTTRSTSRASSSSGPRRDGALGPAHAPLLPRGEGDLALQPDRALEPLRPHRAAVGAPRRGARRRFPDHRTRRSRSATSSSSSAIPA
jgi:hypothetical protein